MIKGVAHRYELDVALLQFVHRVGVGDDAAAGEQPDVPGVPGVQFAAAQRDAELAGSVRGDPPNRPGVAVSVHPLQLPDKRVGGGPRCAAHRCGRVQRRSQIQR